MIPGYAIIPTPDPSEGGPVAPRPGSAANAPIQRVTLPGEPCFSGQPNQIANNPPAAAPGPAPTVSPVLTHSNSGSNHEELTDGVDFTPHKSVHLEVRPTVPGVFDRYVTDRDASASGAIHVKCGLQTVSLREPGAKSGYVVATDVTTHAITAPLPVTIFPRS